MELKPGDVIITGRPAGVGAIVAADKVAGGIDGLGEIDIAVGQPIVRRPGAAARDWLGDSQQIPFALCGEDPSASDNLPPSRHRPMLHHIACDFPCVAGVPG
jgi:hypothetical protein